MSDFWISARVRKQFADDLSLLAKAEGDGDRSTLIKRVLGDYLREHLASGLQKRLDQINQTQQKGG